MGKLGPLSYPERAFSLAGNTTTPYSLIAKETRQSQKICLSTEHFFSIISGGTWINLSAGEGKSVPKRRQNPARRPR
jgi:hypothetical protein